MAKVPNILFVHGAWANASSWGKVLPLIDAAGLSGTAVSLSLTSLADDVATVKHAIELIDGPVLLVGHSYGGSVITGIGSAVLAVAIHASSDLTAYSRDRLGQALEKLLRRAAAAQAIRDDVSAEDILRTVVGLCHTHDKPGWQGNVRHLVDVLRRRHAARPSRLMSAA